VSENSEKILNITENSEQILKILNITENSEKSNENEVKYIDLRRKIMFRICSEFSVMFRICSEFSVMFRIC
jgi:hypothetical protein